VYFIWQIAKRQFASNIFSFRLLIGLIVCFALFVTSAHVLMKDYEKRLTAHMAEKNRNIDSLKEVKVYSGLSVGLDKAPEPLSVICSGMERQLGSLVRVSCTDVPTKAIVLVGDDPLLKVFSAIDIVIIMQIVASLFVILIAYDAISGEREGGTLALVMANSVSRYHVLIGKYLGGMASILLPLSIGWLAGLAVIHFSPMVEFYFAEWGRFCLLFGVSALYISVFFLLSMLVSVKSKRSATALVWLLFLWVVLVIPNVAAYMAGHIRPIESRTRVDAERRLIMAELQVHLHLLMVC